MRRFLCWLGVHEWHYSSGRDLYRYCEHCEFYQSLEDV